MLCIAAIGTVLNIRYNGAVPDPVWRWFLGAAAFIGAITIVVNRLWGSYGQIWEHASIPEARRVLLAGGTLAVLFTVFDLLQGRPVPLSAAIGGPVLYIGLAGAVRFQSRLFALRRRRAEGSAIRVAVVGAGATGTALLRDMLRTPHSGLLPVVLLDDDPRLQGRTCSGVRVAGTVDTLFDAVDEHHVHEVVLAIRDASSALVRKVADLADRAGVPLRIVPGVSELVHTRVSVHDLRDLSIEDLLGRVQVSTDLAPVRQLISGRRVLITGAGGSIGSELAKQVAAYEPAQLLLLDHDETHLHDVRLDLGADAVTILADIREADVINRVFLQHRPEIVFHAAAHKHVPVLEDHPAEAVRTNCLGTALLMQAAELVDVERFVLISTDKAVAPSSVMGATKRIAEQVVLGYRPARHSFCAVRFGNVLGSRGSVLPTFMHQIRNGGPVTITDPRMTRYFMSMREAVQLVLQAAARSAGGEVFVLEMGEPVRIVDLAERMIRLSGRRVGGDVEIRVTGARPGEKLTEELHTAEEVLLPTGHPSISKLYPVTPDHDTMDAALVTLSALASEGDDHATRDAVFGLADPGRPTPPRVPSPRQGPVTEPTWGIGLMARG
jgi:FlaA1/EpsC-like NDP-sugar epimerase